MTRILTLALTSLALVAAGCGSDNNKSSSSSTPTPATTPAETTPATTTGSSSPTAAGKTIDVDLKNISFDPKTVNAKVGDTIKWENYDDVDHNVVATKGEEFKSDNFGKGGEYKYKLDKAGTIEYVCTIHPGMTGTIKVTS
jgi:plastocyanin